MSVRYLVQPNLQQLPISYEAIRSLVVEVIKSVGEMDQVPPAVARLAVSRDLIPDPRTQPNSQTDIPPNPTLQHSDAAKVLDIVWDLIVEGVLRPGSGDYARNVDLPFFHISEWGKEALKDGLSTPYDPDGYLTRLRAEVPNLDLIIITYLNESLHTFRIGCLLSSTIALGCAAEKAILLLIASYRDSLRQVMKEKFGKNTDGLMIKRQFDEFRKMLVSELRPRLPRDVDEGLDVQLNLIFDFIRNQRNDAGHPTGTIVEREVAYANLVVFPVYLRKVYALLGWVKQNPQV